MDILFYIKEFKSVYFLDTGVTYMKTKALKWIRMLSFLDSSKYECVLIIEFFSNFYDGGDSVYEGVRIIDPYFEFKSKWRFHENR